MGYPKNHKYGSKGYKKEDTSEIVAKHHSSEGLELRIHKDGTVEAEGFKDKSSDGLEYDELQGNAGFTFHKPLDENTELYYVPNSVRRYYSTTVSIDYSIKDVFAQFRGEVTKLVITDLLRYKKAKKSLKTAITKLNKKKHHFIFTKRSNDLETWYPIPYSQSWSVGPYNYPTILKVTKQIDNLNDLLVIKTGTFMSHWSNKNKASLLTPYDERVVYISPHETYGISGSVYTHLGSGQITNTALISTHSSNHLVIPEGETLYSGTQFYDIRESSPFELLNNGINPSETPYAAQYIKSENIFTGEWDGVIPSGAYARIETVSTDGKYLGFDGEISAIQYTGNGGEKIDVDCAGSFTGIGIDAQYEYSVSKAISAAQKKYYKKLKLLLTSLGVKNKTAKMKRYERMLDRVAQNVYDGFGTVRNEKVGAAQGTVSSPIGSPIYYDGILNMYGGSRAYSNYSYADIYLDKMTNPIAHLLYPASGIYAGALSAGWATSSSPQRTTSAGGSAGGGVSY